MPVTHNPHRDGFLYANVTVADHNRLRCLAARDQQSLSGLVRAAVNDYLEAIGEAMLEELGKPKRKARAVETWRRRADRQEEREPHGVPSHPLIHSVE